MKTTRMKLILFHVFIYKFFLQKEFLTYFCVKRMMMTEEAFQA